MSFRTILILINVVAIAALLGFILYRVVSLRRNPPHREPDNLTPFFDDDVLEGPHLERVLGVSLIALVIVLLGMVGYFMREPFRSAEADDAFKDRSIERGAVLFANSQSEDYNPTVSLLCADCHGVDGGGGTAPFTVKSSDPRCDPDKSADDYVKDGEEYCLPTPVSWAAPNLQLAGLRYNHAQLTEIITFGRPGTPMPAWGVRSGRGALNEQSVNDLVNYVESIVTTGDKAKAQATKDLADFEKTLADPEVAVAADEWVASATATLAEAQAELDALGPTADRTTAENYVTYAQEGLAAATEWRRSVARSSDGQVLFMNNCARCHTRGWSYFDPLDPTVTQQGLMGGGAYGPNLRDGQVNRQFPPPTGEAELFAWISEGVAANQGYGARGISSGRMPHFGAVLDKGQICEIMAYERSIENPPESTAGNKDCGRVILASELTHKGLWYPTILGVLVVVAAIVLFCGSVYVLLGTNLGARLGFLVAFTGLTGFLVILSLLWCTTSSPLNTLKGRIPSWKVQQVVTNLDKAKLDTARDIAKKANVVDPTEAANVKAAVDERLVTKTALPTAPVEEHANDFAQFDEVTNYQILETFEVGGSDPQFWKGEFTHSQEVAVAQFCGVAPPPEGRPFGLPPLPPECADGGKTGYVILTRDLGSLRVPPFVAFVGFSILFGLGLLMLHWRERDEQEAEAAAQAPPSPAPVPAKV